MKRLSDLEIVDAYVEHGSVWRAADALGMVGQTVHARLTKIGAIKNLRRFSDGERDRLVQYYRETPPDEFSLHDLAEELGRTRQFICRKARDLGLTSQRRPLSKAHKAKTKPFDWTKNLHPRGASGMSHSDETKAKISLASKRMWATHKTFGMGLAAEEARQARSDAMSAWRAEQPAQNAYSRAKSGRRSDLGGMYFRSAWEANYARYLNWLKDQGEIERWEYEPETFWFLQIKRGVRSYKPDFRVWEKGQTYLVEVKGWMDAKSKTKLKRMKKYFPEERLVLVDKTQYQRIKQAVSRLIPGWES